MHRSPFCGEKAKRERERKGDRGDRSRSRGFGQCRINRFVSLRSRVKFTRVIFRSLLNVSHVFARCAEPRISVYAEQIAISSPRLTSDSETSHIAVTRNTRKRIRQAYVVRSCARMRSSLDFPFATAKHSDLGASSSAFVVPRTTHRRSRDGTWASIWICEVRSPRTPRFAWSAPYLEIKDDHRWGVPIDDIS